MSTHRTLWPSCALCEGTGRYMDDEGPSPCLACICSDCREPTETRYDLCNACYRKWRGLALLSKAVAKILGAA